MMETTSTTHHPPLPSVQVCIPSLRSPGVSELEGGRRGVKKAVDHRTMVEEKLREERRRREGQRKEPIRVLERVKSAGVRPTQSTSRYVGVFIFGRREREGDQTLELLYQNIC